MPNDAPNTRGPKVARLQDKVKGKMAKNTSPQKRNGQKVRAEGEQAEAVSRKDGPPPQEENANETSEGGNEKALPCAFTEGYIWFYTHHRHCQFKGKTMIA